MKNCAFSAYFAGGGPAATYARWLAKESRQRNATALPLPLRGSRLCKSKNGKALELASQANALLLGVRAGRPLPFSRRDACISKPLLHLKQSRLLFPFFAPHKRQLHSGTSKSTPHLLPLAVLTKCINFHRAKPIQFLFG